MRTLQIAALCFAAIFICSCGSVLRLNASSIRPWSQTLTEEYPSGKPIIAHYKRHGYELFYLAARHENDFGSETLNLVQELFARFHFNVLIIEPIRFDSGESPQWFIDRSKEGRTDKFIVGGESSLAALLAKEKNIPFFGGGLEHSDVYLGLKEHNYSDEDILAFYVVRQIPQWILERESVEGLLERKVPPFLEHYCKALKSLSCPTLTDIKRWYVSTTGRELSAQVSSEETAPYADGNLKTQKISSAVGAIRDRYTLALIETMLHKYKRVAVVYGGSHYVTLKKSLDSGLGSPTFIEGNSLH